MSHILRQGHTPVPVQGSTDIPVWVFHELALIGLHRLYLSAKNPGDIHQEVYPQGLSHLIKGHVKVRLTTTNGIAKKKTCGPVIRVKLQRRGGIDQLRPEILKQIDHPQKRPSGASKLPVFV